MSDITDISSKYTNDKLLKTDNCTLNAIKRYKLKNNEKIKEYHKQYNKQKRDEKIILNPNLKLTKLELIDKIYILENKIKEYELKLNINI
jgi:hypothetical protein